VTSALVVSKSDLIAMKGAAGRPKDIEDIRTLSLTLGPPGGADGADGAASGSDAE